MIRQLSILFALCLFSTFGVNAKETIAGSWQGELAVNAQVKLPLVFHINQEDGKYTVTMDSPAQGATGIPVNVVRIDDSSLEVTVDAIGMRYTGSLNSSGHIEGTFSQNGMKLPLMLSKSMAKQAMRVRPQTPTAPFSYSVENVKFTNKTAGITLAGTLTKPSSGKDFPVAILISGSGPQDRDETLFDHKPFLVIADYLTNKGIAVLRFDDRGTNESQGSFAGATSADFATDVQAAFEFLASRKDINPNKIGLIGHSEGGMIAPMVAAKNDSIAFVVMLAGPGTSGKDILLEQSYVIQKAMGVDEGTLQKEKQVDEALFQQIIDGLDEKDIADVYINQLAMKAPQAAQKAKQLASPWMRFFLAYNPADYLPKVKSPLLALNGENDLQVVAKSNIAGITNIMATSTNSAVTVKVLPGLNHLFQPSETGLPNEYGKIEQTIALDLLSLMTSWIKENV